MENFNKVDRKQFAFLWDFRAYNDQIKNNLNLQDDKLNGRPNRKLQINATQKKTEAHQSRKENEEAKAKRDIVCSFAIWKLFISKLHN